MVPIVVTMVIRNHQVKEFFRRDHNFLYPKEVLLFSHRLKKINQKVIVGLFSTMESINMLWSWCFESFVLVHHKTLSSHYGFASYICTYALIFYNLSFQL